MSAHDRVAPSYVEARRRFLDAAVSAGARVRSSLHPRRGLDGEELYIDLAELGDAESPNALLIVSGTHGVEGFCGSALQTRWLAELTEGPGALPDGLRVLLVHALNPFGFSWVRRTNEDNVDLNRNFIDWAAPPPENPAYDQIADFVVPTDRSPEAIEAADGAMVAWVMELGMEQAQQVVSGGQYRWPGGVFFGGDGPAWSNDWLRTLFAERLDSAERVGVIDLHTGLGEWGHGELISSHRTDSDGYRRASECWGDVRSMLDGQSVSAELVGDWLNVVDSFSPGAQVTAAALEFGTVDPISVIMALRNDAWLHFGGDPLGDEGAAIREQVRAAFVDDSVEWFDTVWRRFDTVATQALTSLAAGR